VDAVLNSSVKMDWQTPDNLLVLVRVFNEGPILLDPCTVRENPTQATFVCTPENDGLKAAWHLLCAARPGLVYVNPPYGRALREWTRKCSDEAIKGAEIVLLVPARPDTNWFQDAASFAGGEPVVLFWKGRLKFKGAKDAAPFPSALFYWGPRADRFREVFAGRGLFL
jgi:hypothetical protein